MNKKILIVRGSRQNTKTLSFLLAGSGYQICAPSKPSDAIEAARHQRFDLAITDSSLPENSPDLSLVSSLKKAQPNLPVFLVTNEHTLETVISCIRAGVTEVINEKNELKTIIETTKSYLQANHGADSDDEITWEDMLEVERVLEANMNRDGARAAAPVADAGDMSEMNSHLSQLQSEKEKLKSDLADAMVKLQRSQTLIDELKGQNGNQATDSEMKVRQSELDAREESLKSLSTKIALQKVELETELAEIEAQKIELEEAKKEVQDSMDANPAALYSLNQDFEREKTALTQRISTLEAELAEAQQSPTELDAETIKSLNERINELRETIAEKDFIIEQRNKELDDALSSAQSGGPLAEQLEQDRRLIEIEKHKIEESKADLQRQKQDLEERHNKSQRELQVERRDAEVSLRELQNKIKEEQLKQQVEQANLKEERRLFEQARQNFQEDVQELQSKQAELRKMEAYLQEMEKTIKTDGSAQNSLPRPDIDAAMQPFAPSPDSMGAPPPQAGLEQSIPAGNPGQQAAPGSPENGDPNTWAKPDFQKSKAGRGPLRIGRKSSF